MLRDSSDAYDAAVPDLEFRRDGSVARITINRPERRNAMSVAVLQGLREAIRDARTDDDIRTVIITGAGDKAFCTGADLSSIGAETGAMEAHEGRGLLADLFRDMWKLGKPIIARVRGYALAGGFGLAMACDFVIASEDAQFGTPEINVGLWPYMITVPLLRSLPPRLAFELMATGRRVDAAESLRVGIVNQVVPVERLDAAVDELAATLAEKSPLMLRHGREAFLRAMEMPSDLALEYLQAMLTITSASDDAREGVAAFIEKRAPKWTGR